MVRDKRVQPVLWFLGGVRTVTGSKYLVDSFGTKVLIDCGLFQGKRELRRLNWRPFTVPSDQIDAVILTHAHLDHSGYLPALVRQGYSGPVYTTPYAAKLAEIVLKDSARLLAEDADHANAHGWSRHQPALPLYTEDDVDRVLAQVRPLEHDKPADVAPNARVTLRRGGHILGSSWAELTVNGADGPATIVSSGDLGTPVHAVLRPPEPFTGADVLLVESTYGSRSHADEATRQDFAEAITRTLDRGGSVLIPAFAVDRTEVILRTLHMLIRAGQVPAAPVYVDSPMALATLKVYQQAVASGDDELRADVIADGPVAFDPGRPCELYAHDVSGHPSQPARPSVILSASGMATGGKVLHHLRHMLPDKRNTVMIVGYAAEGTRARHLASGARAIKIHGQYVPVRAEVAVVEAFSAHADAGDVISWLIAAGAPAPRTTFVIHGESSTATALRDRIDAELGWTTVVPEFGERVLVGTREEQD